MPELVFPEDCPSDNPPVEGLEEEREGWTIVYIATQVDPVDTQDTGFDDRYEDQFNILIELQK